MAYFEISCQVASFHDSSTEGLLQKSLDTISAEEALAVSRDLCKLPSNNYAKEVIEYEWSRFEQWELDKLFLGGNRAPVKGRKDIKEKKCRIQNDINQCEYDNGLSTES